MTDFAILHVKENLLGWSNCPFFQWGYECTMRVELYFRGSQSECNSSVTLHVCSDPARKLRGFSRTNGLKLCHLFQLIGVGNINVSGLTSAKHNLRRDTFITKTNGSLFVNWNIWKKKKLNSSSERVHIHFQCFAAEMSTGQTGNTSEADIVIVAAG